MFIIDSLSRVPVYEQIIKQTLDLILIGNLKSGDKMPSVRNLSISLSVNPNTIQKAYTQLDMMKIIITVPGKGSFISDEAVSIIEQSSRKKMEDLENVLQNLALAGISREEILKIVNKVYTKENE